MKSNEWMDYKISELCEIKYGKDHKRLGDGVIPVFGSGGVMRHVDSYIHDKPSVLIPRKGTLSNLFYTDKKFWTVDTLFWTKINESVIYPKFFFYNLLTLKLDDMNVGTAVPSLTTTILNELIIEIPKLDRQKEIANILSSLDDKIELNNKINTRLEELAQILYKRWFVDFEFPNEEGEPYKSSGGEMIESEIGLIPKGWEVRNLKSLLEFERGIEPGSKNYLEKYSEGLVPFYRVGDLNGKNCVYIDKSLTKNKHVNEKNVLVAFDGAIGRVGIGFNGSYSTGLRKIYSKNEELDNSFVYLVFKSDNIQNSINEHANGTTILHAGSSINHLKIAYNENTINEFTKISKNIYNYLIELISENEMLTKLRDTLLPKLMNGEIEVPV